jgi:DNA-binding transcriptional MocR family regulator
MTQINFLRGVPAEEALVPVAKEFSREYRNVLQKHGASLLQYQTSGLTDFNGYVPLKRCLAQRFSVNGDPSKRLICTNGGMETFSLLLKSFPSGTRIATESLTYDRVLSDIKRHEHQAFGVPLAEQGVDLNALEKQIQAEHPSIFYQIAYHQNPTGITTSLENLETASELCAESGVLHVLDIAYFELRYDGQSNQLVDLEKFPETTVLLGSFTKTLSPGTKCGFGIFPEAVLKRLTPVVANTRLNPNYPTQATINRLIESGFYDRHLSFLQDLYKPRMEAVNESIRTCLPDLSVPHLAGGFFLGLSLPGLARERQFIQTLQSRGVKLEPPKVFAEGGRERYWDDHGAAFFRLTFPFFTPEENRRGIEAIAKTYHEYR